MDYAAPMGLDLLLGLDFYKDTAPLALRKIPTGFCPPAQGCAATLGYNVKIDKTATRFWPVSISLLISFHRFINIGSPHIRNHEKLPLLQMRNAHPKRFSAERI